MARVPAVALAGTVAVAVALGPTRCGEADRPSSEPVATTAPPDGRAGQVADHAAEVMPFDVDRATHAFDPTATGLVETVTTDAPVDPAQVTLIRDHLASEATRFNAGDFSDPARIHGDDMPGLAVLRASPGGVTVAYADVPAGARLTYTGATPDIVDALHRFGGAQSMDHGHH
jgi:hypothetical protein